MGNYVSPKEGIFGVVYTLGVVMGNLLGFSVALLATRQLYFNYSNIFKELTWSVLRLGLLDNILLVSNRPSVLMLPPYITRL